MALQKAKVKEILSEAGCDPDKIGEAVQKILDGHVASIDALKEERDDLKTELDKAKEDLKELDTLKKDSEDVSALRKEYDDFKAKVEAEKVRGQKESAYREILKEAGVPEKHFAKILKYSDVDGIEFEEDGKVKGASEIMKNIKDEWGDHITTESVSGQQTPTPPTNSPTPASKTLKEIMTIKNTTQRQAEIANLLQNQNKK